jgi:2-oxoglutarate ferredoxin oxidoreductase subunit beta
MHKGAAFIDVLSPCVAFNNHPGSTKSYDYVREHNDALNRLDVMVPRQEIIASYAPGSLTEVVQHDGSILRLRKLHDGHDPTDQASALHALMAGKAAGEIVTGLIYVDPEPGALHESLGTVAVPLNGLGDDDLCPGVAALDKINASLRS